MKLNLPSQTMALLLIVVGFLHGCGSNEVKGNGVRIDGGRVLTSQKTMAQAKQGNKYQQHNLGLMYLQGKAGLPKNSKLGAKWVTKAANSGFANAQFLLGDLYVDGAGVEKTMKKPCTGIRNLQRNYNLTPYIALEPCMQMAMELKKIQSKRDIGFNKLS